MVVSRIALVGALAILALSSVEAVRPWPASTSAVRPRVVRSHRPARPDPEAGEFVHAISRGSRWRAFLERA
jgi:hypothetical protein